MHSKIKLKLGNENYRDEKYMIKIESKNENYTK